ncbi:uncharacterized protein LOC127851559 isoform X2 [Dreissena polymorpha]|uniref:Voltage-gated hydrogen channel 1 n=1 Tax=Dreissena polymorpha TaxID=45954 RepID=A0A9D4N5Z9_DREPO|nr:uncharacterized protein LOC127851559 isoform X2 [Dreissena polymorpha]KAH3890347.1 hypothetical protein DPMN_014426 [Dreissena polymorpha]
MGHYSANPSITSALSSIHNLRRPSLYKSAEEGLNDLGKGLNLGRDSEINPTDIAAILQKRRHEKRPLYRCRKRMNILLHTHIALIAVCILSSLDAVCVIGQVICDILIMSDKLAKYDKLHEETVELLVDVLPDYFTNDTDYSAWSFEKVVQHIKDIRANLEGYAPHLLEDDSVANSNQFLIRSLLSRRARSAGGPSPRAGGGGEEEEHDILHELTHAFHIGSMVLLSVLLAETFLKIFAMGKHFLNHKLEIFDGFVIIVSWSLDMAFWEGIWARPGQEGATLLIFILPWRVIRIVNSFVLVIQEKDLVMLKVVKQRLRMALRRDKETAGKLDKYRLEVRQLQGLCRKHGADESSIQACCPTGRRRRSSLFQSLTSLASVALVSAMGSRPPNAADRLSSSSESDDEDMTSLPTTDGGRRQSDCSTASVVLSTEPADLDYEITVRGDRINGAFNFDDESVSKYDNAPKRDVSTKL